MKTKNLFVASVFMIIGTISYVNAQSAAFHDPISFKLKNGMNIIIAENTRTPKVYSNFSIENAEAWKSAPIEELLLTEMLNKTATESQAGISFSEKGGNLATSIAGFENSLELLSETVKNANLGIELFSMAKSTLKESLKKHLKYYSDNVNESTIETVSLNDVMEFYAHYYQPSKATLTIAGNITPAEAKILVKKAFGSWKENQETNSTISR
jgi:predicted Zn-dependent peptidase